MSEKHTIYGTNLDDVLEEAEQPGNVIDYQPGTHFSTGSTLSQSSSLAWA